MTAATEAHIRIWWVPIPRKSSGSDMTVIAGSGPGFGWPELTRAILLPGQKATKSNIDLNVCGKTEYDLIRETVLRRRSRYTSNNASG